MMYEMKNPCPPRAKRIQTLLCNHCYTISLKYYATPENGKSVAEPKLAAYQRKNLKKICWYIWENQKLHNPQ